MTRALPTQASNHLDHMKGEAFAVIPSARKNLADWSEWSEPQIRVLCELDFTPPLHETHLRRRAKARSNTLRSLERAGLIRREWLTDDDAICALPFFRLTQQGQAVKRDWLNWNARVQYKVAAFFGREA